MIWIGMLILKEYFETRPVLHGNNCRGAHKIVDYN